MHMQNQNRVSAGAFLPLYATGCNGAYRGARAAHLETGKPSRNSTITPEGKAIWYNALSGINHPTAYPNPGGCS
jgi:hypothetical protein